MNLQPDNFEQLKKLLTLKRYEQPPPGYFDKLSASIAGRLEAAESSNAFLPWWQRLGLIFEFKPALVCAACVIACGLLSAVFLSALQGNNARAASTAPQLAFGETAFPTISAPVATPSSIEPVLTQVSSSSPFEQFTIRAQPAVFTPGH